MSNRWQSAMNLTDSEIEPSLSHNKHQLLGHLGGFHLMVRLIIHLINIMYQHRTLNVIAPYSSEMTHSVRTGRHRHAEIKMNSYWYKKVFLTNSNENVNHILFLDNRESLKTLFASLLRH